MFPRVHNNYALISDPPRFRVFIYTTKHRRARHLWPAGAIKKLQMRKFASCSHWHWRGVVARRRPLAPAAPPPGPAPSRHTITTNKFNFCWIQLMIDSFRTPVSPDVLMTWCGVAGSPVKMASSSFASGWSDCNCNFINLIRPLNADDGNGWPWPPGGRFGNHESHLNIRNSFQTGRPIQYPSRGYIPDSSPFLLLPLLLLLPTFPTSPTSSSMIYTRRRSMLKALGHNNRAAKQSTPTLIFPHRH